MMQRVTVAEKNVSESAVWPTVAIRAEHQQGEYSGSSLAGDRVYLTFNYQPGAGVSSYFEAKAAASKVRAAEMMVEVAKRDALDKARTELIDHKTAKARLAAQLNTSKLSQDILISSARLFVLGKRSWLDLLNFERELFSSQILESEYRAQVVGTKYRLRLLAGDNFGNRDNKLDE
jgi:adhesin transport system outer membrane protein